LFTAKIQKQWHIFTHERISGKFFHAIVVVVVVVVLVAVAVAVVRIFLVAADIMYST